MVFLLLWQKAVVKSRSGAGLRETRSHDFGRGGGLNTRSIYTHSHHQIGLNAKLVAGNDRVSVATAPALEFVYQSHHLWIHQCLLRAHFQSRMTQRTHLNKLVNTHGDGSASWSSRPDGCHAPSQKASRTLLTWKTPLPLPITYCCLLLFHIVRWLLRVYGKVTVVLDPSFVHIRTH